MIYRILFYAASLLILAVGLTLNTKATLGVSPIISIAYIASELLPVSFGDTTLVLYTILVLIEISLHLIHYRTGTGIMTNLPKEKQKKHLHTALVTDVLQIALSLVFTRFLNLFGDFIPVFEDVYAGTFWGSLAGRVIVLAFAIIFTGIGAALSLDMRIIPNPGDGIVQAISDTVKKPVGFCKNMVDASCIVLSAVIGFFFAGKPVGIGIGTVLAMLFVGRVVALFNHVCLKKIAALSGLKTLQ